MAPPTTSVSPVIVPVAVRFPVWVHVPAELIVPSPFSVTVAPFPSLKVTAPVLSSLKNAPDA